VVAVLVGVIDAIDDVVLTMDVTDVVADVGTALESVVTVADSEVVIPADVVPSDVWAEVVVAIIDDWVVTPVFSAPDGRSMTQITPTSRIMIRIAAMGTKAVLPNFNYGSTIRSNPSRSRTCVLKHLRHPLDRLSFYPRQVAL
jgi:hypothetical protein